MAEAAKLGSPSDPLPGRALGWLLGGLVLGVAPHAQQIPWWISCLFAVSVAWRIAVTRGVMPFPNRWLLAAITLSTALAIVLHHGMLIGPVSGTSLLISMSGLKLLETRCRRDSYLAVILGFLVVVTWFFASQSFAAGAYLFLSVIILTAAMVSAATVGGEGDWFDPLRPALVLFAQAMPFALILFVLVPRLQVPLWHLPERGATGVTGLSDRMAPGAVSHLAQSMEVAFRVRFAGRVPERRDLYWRGPVLDTFDGRTWTRRSSPWRSVAPLRPAGPPTHYTTILQPHGRRWLFALDLPDRAPRRAQLTPSYELLWDVPVDRALSYTLRSHISYTVDTASESAERSHTLSFPRDSNPRTYALGNRLRSSTHSDRDRVRKVLSMFREQPFVYTLQPPALLGDTSDQFLFETRRGFCEHFASSFVLLMRAAGVPARVVTGYQGGELNPIDEYLIVRQSDAHAWAEVWLDDVGWSRVDPTAAVSPERIELGVHAAVGAQQRLPLLARRDFPLVHRLVLAWDALNNRWNEWVVGYSAGTQQELLAALGIDRLGYVGAIIALVAVLPVAGLILWIAAKMGARQCLNRDPTGRAYDTFCRRLARRGMVRGESEAPVAFADRAAIGRPDLAIDIRRITRLYTRLRYGKQASPKRLAAFRDAVRAFRPGRAPKPRVSRPLQVEAAERVGSSETRHEASLDRLEVKQSKIGEREEPHGIR